MRSMWSGQLGFGLVQIPVKLFKATESHDIAFHQHHGPDCLGRVGMVRVCKECGEVVEYADMLKGIEVGEQVVMVTADDLADLQDEQGKQIEILQFVEASEIDPVMFENSYYIGAPDGAKAYALLAQSMAGSGLVAIARFSLRAKTQLAALRVLDGVLVLHTLLWPDEVREADVPGLGGDFSAAEMTAASTLVESMVGKFEPESYTDQYQQRLQELIAAKADGAEFATTPATTAGLEDVSDLLAKLEASIAKHPAGKRRAPAKKAPRKKVA